MLNILEILEEKMINHLKSYFTVYSTTRQVNVKSKLLAITYLTLVITVWCAYIGSLQLDLRKVYQKECPVYGAIVSKVKGVITTEDLDDSEFEVDNPKIYKRVWDTSDLIFPPYGGDGADGGFVVITNLLITANQTKGLCPEYRETRIRIPYVKMLKKGSKIHKIGLKLNSNKTKIAKCSEDKDCKKGRTSPASNGVLTGKCTNTTNTCEVSAWCPVEQNVLPLKGRALLDGVQNFTVMLKNSVEFPDCGKDLHKRNILESASRGYLSNCVYDINNDTTCPIFRLRDVIQWSGNEFSDVAKTGGVFRIEARWDCDFDWGFSDKECFPTYHFSRIDEADAKISPGWNFRSASYHEEDRRTMKKMYGLKILVQVTGQGKRFDFLTLILNVGATIGLFALAPLVCDALFEFLCGLKKLKPFSNILADFSVKARYRDTTCCANKPTASNFELSASNNTVEESIGTYKTTR